MSKYSYHMAFVEKRFSMFVDSVYFYLKTGGFINNNLKSSKVNLA